MVYLLLIIDYFQSFFIFSLVCFETTRFPYDVTVIFHAKTDFLLKPKGRLILVPSKVQHPILPDICWNSLKVYKRNFDGTH